MPNRLLLGGTADNVLANPAELRRTANELRVLPSEPKTSKKTSTGPPVRTAVSTDTLRYASARGAFPNLLRIAWKSLALAGAASSWKAATITTAKKARL